MKNEFIGGRFNNKAVPVNQITKSINHKMEAKKESKKIALSYEEMEALGLFEQALDADEEDRKKKERRRRQCEREGKIYWDSTSRQHCN